MFWLCAAALLAGGVAFVVLPLLREASAGGAGRAVAVRSLYKQRLAELDEETRTGLLDLGEREEMEAELGQALLSEWGADANSGGRPPPAEAGAAGNAGASGGDQSGLHAGKARAVAWSLLLGAATALAAVGLYLHLGEPDAELLAQAPEILRLDPGKDRVELDRWRSFLSERVQLRPQEAGSWFLLGSIYMAAADYAAAEAAFGRAHGLTGEGAGIDVHWLQARYLAAGGRLDNAGRRLAEGILARLPSQATALEILGLDAYQRQDFAQAAALFNRALANPLEPLRRGALQAAFNQARTQFGAGKPTIEVAITVERPPPNAATLLLFARPPEGGMPYAVVRRPAAILPQTLLLDDAVSMSPTRLLSAAKTVEVVARISLAGTAAAHPGDWEWRSPPLALAEATAPIALQAELRPPQP